MRNIRDCSVCVVGGAGFLGSHLVDHLIDDRDCRVLVIDNLVAGRREFVHRAAKMWEVDITGLEERLLSLFREYKVDYVFNYAAWPYVPDSFNRPLQVCNVNFFGALKVINAAQEAGCKGILQVSSAEVYGDHPNDSSFYNLPSMKILETDPVVPHSSYGASKAAIDALVQVRWREARTPCIALRQFNCVGPRETHPYVIPEIIGQLSLQKAFDLPEPGRVVPFEVCTGVVNIGNNSTRDFLYAGDAVRMACELLEKGEFGEVYNLGFEEGIRIYDLAKRIGKLMGFVDVQVEIDPTRFRPWDIEYLQSDNSKIYSVIEARPQVGLYEALMRTINWHKYRGSRWPWEDKK